MPYPAAHREQTKEKILRSAQRLFNRHGFTSVSIDDVMSDAGMTRGSFYSYFTSKSDLYAQAVSLVVCEKQTGATAGDARYSARAIIRDYLSDRHFSDVDDGCPMIGLPSEVSRTDPAVRLAFESALKLMVEIFEADAEGKGKKARSQALAAAALCVGGMVLARSIEDRAMADELRNAALSAALGLGAWA